MATDRGGGRGSHTAHGIRGTMSAPFSKAAGARTGSSSGMDGRNKAPFDTPQGMGGGSIPTRFFDTSMSAKPATTVNAGRVSPPIGGTQNVGQRRFRNPR